MSISLDAASNLTCRWDRQSRLYAGLTTHPTEMQAEASIHLLALRLLVTLIERRVPARATTKGITGCRLASPRLASPR